ncbi:MAG: hypothetical protein DRP59_12525 [Spirochaetes bacterium]|nr:MAG: hypothetical protein DRP59_12525 [Spirochaetota bacterium]
MNKVRVVIWGFGAMGSGMAKMLLSKKGFEITGVCDTRPDRTGKSIFDLTGMERGTHPEVIVEKDIEKAVAHSADIALLATDSFTAKAFNKIIFLVEKGLNVITTAEEMAYPRASEPELSRKIDDAAKRQGVSVLGTGINPGLIMDLLVVLMSGACIDVEHIEAKRVNSLSPFGPAVMEEQGVGLNPSVFEEGVKNGTLSGHVGFNESVRMIADALGWRLDGKVQQAMRPIVSHVPRKTEYASIKTGDVAGCDMRGSGVVDGENKIEMIHPQQIEPQDAGIETGDYITIKGTPDIHLSIKPEVPGGIGTIAMCVNMIPQVINTSPGLKTMLDLPVPRALMGDVRERIERRG